MPEKNLRKRSDFGPEAVLECAQCDFSTAMF